MRKMSGWIALAVIVVAAAIVFEYATQPPPLPPPRVEAPATATSPAEPAVRHPVPEELARAELPPLDGSDDLMRQALAGFWDEAVLERLFNMNGFVRRVVATIDNLPRRDASLRLSPVKPAPGAFRVTGTGENLAISPANAARYIDLVRFASGTDSNRLVSAYVRHYPLFQQAYVELGYPSGYFNDRLVEVIDHLLAAPALPPEAKLVQPKVFYRFADPDLESLSPGHKMMLRIGNDNAAALKVKLRELRGALVASSARQ